MQELNILKVDYIEFYVHNAFHTAFFYKSIFGFNIIAINDQTIDTSSKVSYVVQKNDIYLIFTSSFDPESKIYQYTKLHGDGVKFIGFQVKHIRHIRQLIQNRQNIDLGEIMVCGADKKHLTKIFSFETPIQDLGYSFIERDSDEWSMPGYTQHNLSASNSIDLREIDHIAIAINRGRLNDIVQFHEKVFGWRKTYEEEILYGKGGMSSAVIGDRENRIKLVLISPIGEVGSSQIDTYIKYNNGPGVQHLAFKTGDIIKTTQKIRGEGINFLNVPPSYYEEFPKEILNSLAYNWSSLQENNILIDGSKESTLFQAFTQPLHMPPTFFVEIIQRHQHKGFGSKNIKALFKAVATDQERRLGIK